jgi:hypothetical protein
MFQAMLRFVLVALIACSFSSISCKASEPSVEEFTSDSWSLLASVCSCDTITCARTHRASQKKMDRWWPTMIERLTPENRGALEKGLEIVSRYLVLLVQYDSAVTLADAAKTVEQNLKKFPGNEDYLALKKKIAENPIEVPDMELLTGTKKECLEATQSAPR